jgi:hypothetical protein
MYRPIIFIARETLHRDHVAQALLGIEVLERGDEAMRQISPEVQDRLLEVFGTRVTFDPFERQFYRSDVGSLPSLVTPIVGNLTPAGVVQPHTEEELVTLVQLASQYRIPLVPRGKASSGYGGVLPVAGGLVVDLNWMSRIHAVDGHLEEPGERTEHTWPLRAYLSVQCSIEHSGWVACTGGHGFRRF